MAQDSSDGLLRIVVIVLALIVLLPFLMMALAMPFMWTMGGWGGHMTGVTGWGTGMMLGWVLLLVGIGYLAYRSLTRSGPLTNDPAVEELRMQYARGELSDEEFEERRQRLETE